MNRETFVNRKHASSNIKEVHQNLKWLTVH